MPLEKQQRSASRALPKIRKQPVRSGLPMPSSRCSQSIEELVKSLFVAYDAEVNTDITEYDIFHNVSKIFCSKLFGQLSDTSQASIKDSFADPTQEYLDLFTPFIDIALKERDGDNVGTTHAFHQSFALLIAVVFCHDRIVCTYDKSCKLDDRAHEHYLRLNYGPLKMRKNKIEQIDQDLRQAIKKFCSGHDCFVLTADVVKTLERTGKMMIESTNGHSSFYKEGPSVTGMQLFHEGLEQVLRGLLSGEKAQHPRVSDLNPNPRVYRDPRASSPARAKQARRNAVAAAAAGFGSVTRPVSLVSKSNGTVERNSSAELPDGAILPPQLLLYPNVKSRPFHYAM